MKYLLLFVWVFCSLWLISAPHEVCAETTVYVTQTSQGTHTYLISMSPQPYAISDPKVPQLKPICQGYGKDYATMNWLQCAKDGKLK